MGRILVDVVWTGLLVAAAFLAGRASHDPPAKAPSTRPDHTIFGSLDRLVDDGLLTAADCEEICVAVTAHVEAIVGEKHRRRLHVV